MATYGPHVSAYVRGRGAHDVHEAPQAVDQDFWSAPGQAPELRRAAFQVLFAGRLQAEKGLSQLLAAWRITGLTPPEGALVLAGPGPGTPSAPGVHHAGALEAPALRNFYRASDVVVIPSIATRTFREPWEPGGQRSHDAGLPVIATDAVGAAAGGLVRHERNGLVVPAGDPQALAGAIERLRADGDARARMGAAARHDASAYTHTAWATGISRALAAAGASQARAASPGRRG